MRLGSASTRKRATDWKSSDTIFHPRLTLNTCNCDLILDTVPYLHIGETGGRKYSVKSYHAGISVMRAQPCTGVVFRGWVRYPVKVVEFEDLLAPNEARALLDAARVTAETRPDCTGSGFLGSDRSNLSLISGMDGEQHRGRSEPAWPCSRAMLLSAKLLLRTGFPRQPTRSTVRKTGPRIKAFQFLPLSALELSKFAMRVFCGSLQVAACP